jgi:hypothetical protein
MHFSSPGGQLPDGDPVQLEGEERFEGDLEAAEVDLEPQGKSRPEIS